MQETYNWGQLFVSYIIPQLGMQHPKSRRNGLLLEGTEKVPSDTIDIATEHVH